MAPAIAVACGVWSSTGQAQTAPAQEDDHQKAVRAFTAARADIDTGNCRSALPMLEESISYEPSVGAHLSMADCYEQMDLLAAWRELKEAAALAMARNDDRATVARDRAAGLEPRLATLKLTLPAEAIEAANVELRIDGNVVKPFLYLGGIIATTRGVHDIEILAPHKKPWRQRVTIQAIGAPVPVVVALEDEGSSQTTAPAVAGGRDSQASDAPGSSAAEPSDSHPPPGGADAGHRAGDVQRTVGIAVGGVGAAALVLGTIAGIVALAKNAQLRDACGGRVGSCTAAQGSPDVTGPRDAAQAAATVSTVGLVVGGLFVAGGVATFLLAPRAQGPTTTLAIAPLWTDRTFGVALRGDL